MPRLRTVTKHFGAGTFLALLATIMQISIKSITPSD